MLKRFEITPSTVFELLRITDEIALCDKSLSNNLSLPLVSMYPNEITQCPISHSLFALLANDDVNENDNESNSDEDDDEENKVNFIDQVVINGKSAEKLYTAFTKQSATFNPSGKNKRNNNNTERDSSLSKGSISSRTNRIHKSGVKYYNMNTTNSFDKSPERKDILTEKEMLKSIIIKKLAHSNMDSTNRDNSFDRKRRKEEEQIDISNVSNNLLERNLTRNFTPDYDNKRQKRMIQAKKNKAKTKVPQVEFKVDFDAIRRRNDEIKIKKSFMK